MTATKESERSAKWLMAQKTLMKETLQRQADMWERRLNRSAAADARGAAEARAQKTATASRREAAVQEQLDQLRVL
eukprot:6192806-Pleurochrysis_carterae.AAC.3